MKGREVGKLLIVGFRVLMGGNLKTSSLELTFLYLSVFLPNMDNIDYLSPKEAWRLPAASVAPSAHLRPLSEHDRSSTLEQEDIQFQRNPPTVETAPTNTHANPVQLPLDQLKLDVDSFQFRDVRADGYKGSRFKKQSNDHIKQLADVLQRGQTLDPVLVWKDDEGQLWVVDGHHRYKAYQRVCKGEPQREISAIVLEEGLSREEAMLMALQSNIKDKLSMSRAQKTQAAWRLLREDHASLREMSLRQLGRLFGISYETVRKMREALQKFGADIESLKYELWREVLQLNWTTDDDWDPEVHKQKAIEKLTVEIEAALKTYRGEDTEVIQQAIEGALAETHGLTADIRLFSEDPDWDNDEDDDY